MPTTEARLTDSPSRHPEARDIESAYPSIKDYAIIGDSASAALISRRGSIDWLCWPKFDSPSIFGAILDHEIGGIFRIAPSSSYEVTRAYVENTNVLQTMFRTSTGVICLTDLMPQLLRLRTRRRRGRR